MQHKLLLYFLYWNVAAGDCGIVIVFTSILFMCVFVLCICLNVCGGFVMKLITIKNVKQVNGQTTIPTVTTLTFMTAVRGRGILPLLIVQKI